MKIKYTETDSWRLTKGTAQYLKFHKGEIVELKRLEKTCSGIYNLYFLDGSEAHQCSKRWEIVEGSSQKTIKLRATSDQTFHLEDKIVSVKEGQVVEATVWCHDYDIFHRVVLVNGWRGTVFSNRFEIVESVDMETFEESSDFSAATMNLQMQASRMCGGPLTVGSAIHAALENSIVQFNPNNPNPMDTKTMQAAVDNINKQAADSYASQAGSIANQIASLTNQRQNYVDSYTRQIEDSQAKARSLQLKVLTIEDVFGKQPTATS